MELSSLDAKRVAGFINSPRCAAVTRVSKFSSIKCFVDHWSLRGQMPALNLDKPPKPHCVPGPFIYTQDQVKALLDATETCPSRGGSLDGRAARMLLLTLYATGCGVDEVFGLTHSDIRFKEKRIYFKGNYRLQGRCIPIGQELRSALAEYIGTKKTLKSGDEPLFTDRSGEALKKGRFYEWFKSYAATAGLNKRSDGRGPRLEDLRFSFAVHRISQSIRRNDDLNRLLPALSTYMGYASLTRSEQFLAYAPDRFREDLQKLSPAKGSRHWRDDPSLMDDLRNL